MSKTPEGIFAPFVDKYDHTAVWPSEEGAFPVDVSGGESRFEIETRGPWHQVSSVRGLAVTHFDDGVVVHGIRSLLNAHESGYDMEGRVSLGGKTYRAFTSSQLFLVNRKLVNVAILYVVPSKE